MNIFYLDNDPEACAQYHVDKHCVKMILETCQLLSTAHRVLDGQEYIDYTDSGRKVKRWILDSDLESVLYSATHINHPSAVWCRSSADNYAWLYSLLNSLCNEYTYRYGKTHKCEATGLVGSLARIPKNIADIGFTEPTPAMPDQYKVPGDSVQSYHNYYIGEKQRMFSWKQRSIPDFINKHMKTTRDSYASV